ncbi:hypothetical protein ASPBRDRAFT_50921 [Aspergillus brasiliensis CBS 101740]|uniref:FAD-binding domain-containing protein n=1 Tax=Aspergillus brasiliensis (strain CBS 101740 / IMI 381727 / IBT 21946) TaxID=767769 RepID=A0A1L9V2G1_ASPBC|nr:hypothetical protein ASPBRDRAFT_50921 [Aspergillus brasiliensis CBS 101740]
MDKTEFTVIIVGGSISGLALAHCLHHANIPHIVLEKASEPAPQKGASIGIMPNGARILDQLGLWEKIGCYVEPLAKPVLIYPGAYHVESSYPRVMHKSVLQVLYEGYPCPERIRLSEKVIAIESSDDGVTATTANGEIYKGHIIVGADGVHSSVRAEIWKAADRVQPGLLRAEEKTTLTTEYSCIFGISSPIEGMEPGGQVHGGRLYWFLTQKLKRKYTWPDRPRFTDDDMADAAARLDSFRVNNDLTQTQMTPHSGQGANMAMEDAATLTNLLTRLLRDGKPLPGSQQIEDLFKQYHEIRFGRTKSNFEQSLLTVRLCTLDGLLRTLIIRYVIHMLLAYRCIWTPGFYQMRNTATSSHYQLVLGLDGICIREKMGDGQR